MSERQTDVATFISDLDGGVFEQKYGTILSDVALSVNNTSKKGKVTIEIEFSALDENRVTLSHKLKFTAPTMRGNRSEENTTSTPMYVNKGGRLSLFKEDQGQLFTPQGEMDGKLKTVN